MVRMVNGMFGDNFLIGKQFNGLIDMCVPGVGTSRLPIGIELLT